MNSLLFYKILAFLALAFAVLAFASRLRAFSRLARPLDGAPARGQTGAGVLYAYTLGMAPWSKESTRRHWPAYLRGVAFHLGIFLGLGLLLASPWLSLLGSPWRGLLAAGAGLGALLGLIGFAARFIEHNLKALSTLDDYSAVLLVSLFLAAQSLWLFGYLPAALYYLASALMLIYAPFSKIRHCLYFAYSRLFYGTFVGKRAVLPHSQQKLVPAIREASDE